MPAGTVGIEDDMQFVAIDVETANADLASICQVGAAIFQDGKHVGSWMSLVDPEDEFSAFNMAVHGIDEQDVKGAPTWPDVAGHLRELLTGSIVACHTPFDRTSTTRACKKYQLEEFDCRWLDTARVVRRAWPELFAAAGYGLRDVACFLGLKFEHHDALEDARAAGLALCRASAHTGLSLEDWLDRVRRPIYPDVDTIKRKGDRDGVLFGNVAVFTGSLSITRREAADLAVRAGCDVDVSVTQKTTLLIVGDQDITRLAGKQKSSKHIKAERLINQGYQIRILRESDFQDIIATAAN